MMTTTFIILLFLIILQFSSIALASNNVQTTKTKFLRFESEPESVDTELNKKVHFKCNAKPRKSRIQWLINEEPVRIDERAIFTTSDSLIIQLPEKIDQNVGVYTFDELMKSEIQCRAEYKNQVLLSQPAKIVVAFLSDFPLNEADEIKVDVKEQQIALIPCKPPNSPPKVITNFLFKNKLIESNDEKYHLMPSGDLQIFNVTMEDSGQYRCIAHNPWLKMRKNSSSLVTLHVEKKFENLDTSIEQDRSVSDKLEFLKSPKQKYTAFRGTDQLIFECVASSILPVTMNWYRDDRHPLPSDRIKIIGGNLVISNVQATDQGIYNCEATNGHKTITATSELEVQQTPSIKTELDSNRQLHLGEHSEFECSVNGNPIPRIDWYLNGLKLNNLNSAQYDIEILIISEDTSKLIIKKVSEFHHGILQCFASNGVSSVYSVSKLEVIGNGSTISKPKTSTTLTTKNKTKKLINNDMAIPNKPKIIRLSSDSVIVHWKIPKQGRLPITFFKIQYRDLNQFNTTTDWITVEEDIAPNINSFAISSLQSDRFYKFRIMAVYKNQDSQDGRVSDKFFLAKKPTTPRPNTIPTIYEGKSDNSNSIEIYWDCRFELDEKVDGFIIHYRPTQSAESYHKITIDNNRTRAHTITHLAQSKQYDIRIQSFNMGGVSDFSKITTVRTLSALTPDGELEDELIDETPELPDNLNPTNFNENNSKEEDTIIKKNNNSIIELSNNDNKTTSTTTSTTFTTTTTTTTESTEQDNLKAADPLSTQSPLFYLIIGFIALILILLVCYTIIIAKRCSVRKKKKRSKQKNDNKFDLDDENFILKTDEDSLHRSFNEPIYSTNGKLSTNPHLTQKAIKNYNHNYATIGGSRETRSMFNKNNDVYDSSMNIRINKFCDDSISNSLLAINGSNHHHQIIKRGQDLSTNHNNRMSSNTTISYHNLTSRNSMNPFHNKNLLLPELPDTKQITSTLGRHNHRQNNTRFEDLYGKTGMQPFATINRSNSVARLNAGTLERKRKSSRNDLFSVLNIKEENELTTPTHIVDLQGSPNSNYRAVRFISNNSNGGTIMNSTLLNNNLVPNGNSSLNSSNLSYENTNSTARAYLTQQQQQPQHNGNITMMQSSC